MSDKLLTPRDYERRCVAFGCRLRRIRAAVGWLPEELDDACRFERGTVEWLFEAGRAFPDFDQREAMIGHLGVDLHWVAMGEGLQKP